jgi:hypothetical protein
MVNKKNKYVPQILSLRKLWPTFLTINVFSSRHTCKGTPYNIVNTLLVGKLNGVQLKVTGEKKMRKETLMLVGTYP